MASNHNAIINITDENTDNCDEMVSYLTKDNENESLTNNLIFNES